MHTPPPHPDSPSFFLDMYGDPQRITNIFTRFIAVTLLGMGAGIIINLFEGDSFAAVALGVCIVPILLALYFARRKQFELAATFLAVILISLITIVATNNQGIHQIGVLAYPAILIIASLAVRKRTMALITLYNIVCVAWLTLGEYYGIFTPAIPTRSTAGEFVIVVIILILTAFMVRIITEVFFENNLRLQKELKEHKETETALRESELKFRSIFDNSLDAIGVSKAGIHVMANPAYLRMFGYESAEQLAGKSILDLIAPSHRPQILDYVQRRAAGESIPNNYETRGLRSDGTEFDMDVRVSTYELRGDVYTVPILRDITQRKQMEEALRDSEIRYRTIVESTTDLICRFLPDTTLTFVNTAYCQYFGKDHRELVGMRFLEMIPREGWSAVQEQVNSIIFKQESYTYEHEVVAPTGEVRWQQWTDSPVLNDSGQVVELQSVGRDITERKVAEKALQESERRFREMLQGVELAGVMLDDAGRITFINDFLLHITGWSREETLGESWFDKFLPEELREGVRSAFGRLMTGEQAMPHYENEILTRRAERRLIRWNNTVLFDSNGKITGSASVGEDITERKQAEEMIRQSEERFREMAENIHEVFYLSDLATASMLYISPAYETIWGRSCQSLYENSTSFLEAVHPEDVERVLAYLERQRQVEGAQEEYRVIRPDGTVRWVWDRAVPVRGSKGQAIRMCGVVQDITERKRAEEALKENEAIFSSFLEHSPVYVFFKDKQIRSLRLSKNYEQMLGMPIQDLLGKTMDDLFPSDLAKSMVADDMRILHEGKQISVVEELNDRIYETTKFPVLKDGEPFILAGFTVDVTERKQAEEKLTHFHDLMRYIIEHTNSGVAVHDRDLRYIYVSQRYLDQYKIKKENVIGKHHYEVFPDLPQKWRDVHQKALAGQVSSASRDPYYRADGTLEWTRWECRPWYEADGVIGGIIVYTEVITERVRAEEALRLSEAQLSAALRMANAGHWEYDVPSDTFTFNDNFYRIFRTTAEEEGGYELSSAEYTRRFCHPDDVALVGREIQAAIDATDPNFDRQLEHRILYKDGEMGYIAVRFFIVKGAQGRTVKTYGVNQDITKRKQAEDAIRYAEQRYRTLFEEAPVMYVITVNNDGTPFIADCNNTFLNTLGYSRAEVVQQPLTRFYTTASRSHLMDEGGYQRALAGIFTAEERELVTRDGLVIKTLLRAIPEIDPHGNIYGTRAMFVDITERKRMEELLFEEKERAEVTLHSIGDAVITTDTHSLVKYLNPVAEALTGWKLADAVGKSLPEVFRIIEEGSRQVATNPVERCLREERIVGLANHSILISRDGREYSIDDSAAPIRNRQGNIIGVVLVFHDVTEERRLSRQVAHDAMHDSLTGLVNRREFEKRLERALMSTRVRDISHILCYLDLDQFKIVNDTAGHTAGDELLKQISGLLGGLFRQRDTLARLGGDEFGLLLEDCKLDHALIICNEILAKIRDFPFVWAGRSFQVGVSIGVVPLTPQKESVAQLLSQADIACYSAKDLGRGRTFVYHAGDIETAQRHGEILQAAHLRDAMVNDEFRLFCQPIVQLSGDASEFTHYEILLRMTDGSERLALPSAFIPSAERYGLMPAIDRWVIRQTFFTIQEHHARGTQIAINLSGNSLDDENLLDFVLDQLREFSIPPEQICFEITETAAIHHLSKARQFIQGFRERGGRIALDDFGSGFSSFRYLKTLPVDYIKIDGSFVGDMLSNPGDQVMVEAITQVAHALGIKIIAEHASSPDIIEHLRQIGVEYAQGYGIGVPLPVEAALGQRKKDGR